MALTTFGNKQSYEAYFIAFDFFKVVPSGDTITSAEVVVLNPEGVDVTTILTDSVKLNISGLQVDVFIQNGESPKTYKTTCRIVTDKTEKYEMDASITVIDI